MLSGLHRAVRLYCHPLDVLGSFSDGGVFSLFFSVKRWCPCAVQSQPGSLISTSRYCTIAWVCIAVLCLPCSQLQCFSSLMFTITELKDLGVDV